MGKCPISDRSKKEKQCKISKIKNKTIYGQIEMKQ